MSGYVLTWDDVASTTTALTVRKVRRRMTGAVRDRLIDIPGVDGAALFPERRGNRTIIAECSLTGTLGAGGRHDNVVGVADWLDRDGYKKLVVDDQPDQYWLAALMTDPDPDEWRHLAKFQIEWTAKPYAYALAVSSELATGVASGSEQSFSIPDQISAYPVITVTARGGTMTGFTLAVNGNTLTYDGTLATDQSITFSSLSYTAAAGSNTDVELTGAQLSTAFPANISGAWPLLNEGNNTYTVTWTGTATSTDVDIYWRERFR